MIVSNSERALFVADSQLWLANYESPRSLTEQTILASSHKARKDSNAAAFGLTRHPIPQDCADHFPDTLDVPPFQTLTTFLNEAVMEILIQRRMPFFGKRLEHVQNEARLLHQGALENCASLLHQLTYPRPVLIADFLPR